MVAIANIDEIISIIKKSKDPKKAADSLCKKTWKSGPVEAILKKLVMIHKPGNKQRSGSKRQNTNFHQIKRAILELRLGRLTGLETGEFK